jgi:hypothetical protein
MREVANLWSFQDKYAILDSDNQRDCTSALVVHVYNLQIGVDPPGGYTQQVQVICGLAQWNSISSGNHSQLGTTGFPTCRANP